MTRGEGAEASGDPVEAAGAPGEAPDAARTGSAGAGAAGRGPAGAVELAPGLHALCSTVALDGRVTWVPEDQRGLEPVTAYLVAAGDDALLIDTGLACHRAALLDQLGGVLRRGASLAVLLTRIEFDTLGSLQAVARRFAAGRVITASLNPRDFFGSLDAIQAGSPEEALRFDRMRPPGEVVLAGRRTVRVFTAPLFTLGAVWAFDEESGTLFTSDAFGYLHLPEGSDERAGGSEGARWVTGSEALAVDAATVRRQLFVKFDWMLRADVRPLLEGLDAVFAHHDVRTLAPGRGRMVRGREACLHQYRLVRQVLAEVAARG